MWKEEVGSSREKRRSTNRKFKEKETLNNGPLWGSVWRVSDRGLDRKRVRGSEAIFQEEEKKRQNKFPAGKGPPSRLLFSFAKGRQENRERSGVFIKDPKKRSKRIKRKKFGPGGVGGGGGGVGGGANELYSRYPRKLHAALLFLKELESFRGEHTAEKAGAQHGRGE